MTPRPPTYQGSIVTVIPATVTVTVMRKLDFIGSSFLLTMPPPVLADEGASASIPNSGCRRASEATLAGYEISG